ncbi:MAG: hypothetical protein ABIJ56_06865 [Pseudomonadota bacterium]
MPLKYIILIVIAAGLAMWLFFRTRKKKPAASRAAALSARPRMTGAAKILSIDRTGLSVNDQPEVSFSLEVDIGGGRSLHIETKRIVDVLQVPRIQPGRLIAISYDPDDPTDCELKLDMPEEQVKLLAPGGGGSPGRQPSETVSGTGAPFDCPLWLFGMREAEKWLLPPRNEEGERLLVIDFSDPFGEDANDEREWIVDSAAFLIAETFWARTDMQASAAVMVNVEIKKLIHPTGQMHTYEEFEPFLGSLDYRPIVAWGAAGRDFDADGMTAKIHMPKDDSERTITAPLKELSEMLRSWLVGRGVCSSVDRPSWYAHPDETLLPLYAVLLHNLQLQILADKKNKALAPLSPDMHHDFVDFALGLEKDRAASCGQLKIIALTTALYARRAGSLMEDDRDRALAVLDGVKDPAHPLYRLSPHLYRRLDREKDAKKRCQSLLEKADGLYLEWLTSLELE